ncbi:MAG: TM2 domain-containing protein [Alphaproteobacteria bacterium]
MSDSNQDIMRYDANKKSLLIAYLLWFFFGVAGGHRLYIGSKKIGIAMLVYTLITIIPVISTVFALILWIPQVIICLIDLFKLPSFVRGFNNNLIDKIESQTPI